MGIEKWIAAAALGLYIMFVAEVLTVYDFLIDPPRELEPGGKMLMYISISVAPALVLTGTSYLMSHVYGSKPIGAMIVAGGAIMLVGMLYANTLLDKIDKLYLVTEVVVTPPLFMAVSIPVMIFGIRLMIIKRKRPKKQYY